MSSHSFCAPVSVIPLPARVSSTPVTAAMTTDPQDHTVGHALAKVATHSEKHSIDEKNDKGLTPPSDDFIVNSEGVTHEELRTLRNVPDRLPFTAWLVIIVEFAERYVESIDASHDV